MNRNLMQEFNDKTNGSISDMLDNFDKGLCCDCGKSIGSFKDEVSYKEYKITGMCQKCQDELFDSDDEEIEDWIIND
jgi:RNA polymerase-binding transcription factor DksA